MNQLSSLMTWVLFGTLHTAVSVAGEHKRHESIHSNLQFWKLPYTSLHAQRYFSLNTNYHALLNIHQGCHFHGYGRSPLRMGCRRPAPAHLWCGRRRSTQRLSSPPGRRIDAARFQVSHIRWLWSSKAHGINPAELVPSVTAVVFPLERHSTPSAAQVS